jgi:hypothetical protein
MPSLFHLSLTGKILKYKYRIVSSYGLVSPSFSKLREALGDNDMMKNTDHNNTWQLSQAYF